MGIRSSLNDYTTGTQTVDDKIGDAYDVVKNVEEHLTELLNVNSNMGDIEVIVANLAAINGFVVAVNDGVDDAEAAAVLSAASAAQSEASATSSIAAKVAAELAETNAESARDTAITKAAEASASEIAAEADRVAAAASAAAAAVSAGSIGTDAIQTAADRVATGADAVATDLDRIATTADRVATGLDVIAAEADRVATAADRVQTGLDVIAVEADRVAVAADRVAVESAFDAAIEATNDDAVATAADRIQTGLDRIATGSDKAGTAADRIQTGLDVLATAADRVQTGADVLTTVANTGVSTADKNAAALSADEAEAAAAGAIATKALMDTALAGVTDYSNTLAQLSPAAREVVAAADVVDVFIYDTTLDSDGGAWRKRCNWTSWMKETLSSATRGARNQFPQKALLVLRSAGTDNGSLTIYDLDQASCPMWMQFWVSGTLTGSVTTLTAIGSYVANGRPTSVAMLNGRIVVGDLANGISVIDLVSDIAWKSASAYSIHPNGVGRSIADRNLQIGGGSTRLDTSGTKIVNNVVNDVALTVLPGTPVDRVRKLPTPTVAVATAGGVSVIHWDGRVANSASTSTFNFVAFDENYLWYGRTGSGAFFFSPRTEFAATSFALRYYSTEGGTHWPGPMSGLAACMAVSGRGPIKGSGTGLDRLYLAPGSGLAANAQQNSSAAAYVTSKFNTGYMVGNIKLALAESTADLTSMVQGAADFLVGAGAELLVPGSWTMSVSGGSATATESPSGTLNLTGDGTEFARGDQSFTTVVGRRYKFTWTSSSSSNTLKIGTAQGGNQLLQQAGSSATVYFTATTTTTWIRFERLSASLGTVSGLTCKEVVTTVLYDDFGGYADTAAMLAAGWTQGANTTLSLETGTKIKVLNVGTNYGVATKAIAGLIVGQRYKITANLLTISAGFGRIGAFQTATIQTVAERSSPGEVSGTFLATHTTMYLSLWNRNDNNAYSEWGDVRIDVVAIDRSVAANHPLVYGTVTRTAVATGAELAAYGGFSAANYLETAASAITLGTGDFCFTAWAYYGAIGGAIAQEALFAIQGTNEISFEKVSGTTFIRITQTGRFVGTNSTGTLIANAWNHVAFVRSGSNMTYYINGVFAGTSTMPSYDGALTTGTIRTGNRADGAANHKQQIALARAGLTAPTPQQIRDMYEAERPLFQPNAKCLLPADSVSALAYDDTTDLLHVATTSGMARLRDLLVVDKDAIVVTGIDARSGIVVTRDANSADVTQPSLLMRAELLQPDMRTPYDRDRVRGSGVTINATPTIIGRIPLDKGEHRIAEVRVRANQYADGAAYGRYVRRALIDRPEEGNIALGGSVETIGTDGEGTGTQDIGLTVNTTTQTLDITATGLASTNIEWTWEAVLS